MKKIFLLVAIILILSLFTIGCSPFLFGTNLTLKLYGMESSNYNTLQIIIDQIEIHPIGGEWITICDEYMTIDITDSSLLATIEYGVLDEDIYSELRIRIISVYCEDSTSTPVFISIPIEYENGYKFDIDIEIEDGTLFNKILNLELDSDASIQGSDLVLTGISY